MPQTRKRKKEVNNSFEGKKTARRKESNGSQNGLKTPESFSKDCSLFEPPNTKPNSNCGEKPKVSKKSNVFDSCSSFNSFEKKTLKRNKTINSSETVVIKKAKVILHKLKQKEYESDTERNFSNVTNSGLSPGNIESIKNENVKTDVSSKPGTSKENKIHEDSSSESEWEDVEDHPDESLDDYKPNIPKEGVEITIECPEIVKHRRKKKHFDEMEYIRLYINRMKKENQLNVYKVHLLCLIAHGMYVNSILNSSILKGFALSYLPSYLTDCSVGHKIRKNDIHGIKNIVSWFKNTFTFEKRKDLFLNIAENMTKCFEIQQARNASEYNLMFIVFARALGFKTRFCISLYPVSHKARDLIKKSDRKPKTGDTAIAKSNDKSLNVENLDNLKCKKTKQNAKPKKTKSEQKNIYSSKNENADNKKSLVNRSMRSIGKNYKISSDEGDSNESDEDFTLNDTEGNGELNKKKVLRCFLKKTSQKSVKKNNRKVLSSESGSSSPEPINFESDKIVCWSEVYSNPDKQWISIECSNGIFNEPYEIERKVPGPITYILAYDNDSYVKDVTRRYCDQYMTNTIKLRVEPEWWEETLEPFLPPNSKLHREEEKKLDLLLEKKPLPHTVAGFKNHPLYALKRHLLKFQAIYPPDAVPVGYFRSEPVYARDNVCQLHSRETWLKEARVVRVGEEPYKIVKARPKWDKIAGVLRTDLPLEVFGFWQTEQYQPPAAKNGKVPRNEYGNVELFKPCMLPKGTVHLQIPGLNRIAKKLGIDCSPAVIGFDGHKGSIHPVFDGFVICKEYKETILAAWEEEQENARKREEEKREKRIYGNWKKLIRGLLIRERIKLKYDIK